MSTQRGTINQHPSSGSWGFRITYTDTAGKRQYVHKYKKTWRQKDAQQALTACLVQIDAGHNLANNRGTVGAYLLQWFEQWSADDTLKRSTIDTAKIHLDKYLIPAIGTMTLRELKPAKLSAIYRTMMADGRTHGTAPLSAKTIRKGSWSMVRVMRWRNSYPVIVPVHPVRTVFCLRQGRNGSRPTGRNK
jgi:hypothetical protein